MRVTSHMVRESSTNLHEFFIKTDFFYDLTVEKNKETDVYDLSEIDRTNNTAPAIR